MTTWQSRPQTSNVEIIISIDIPIITEKNLYVKFSEEKIDNTNKTFDIHLPIHIIQTQYFIVSSITMRTHGLINNKYTANKFLVG